jgi:hypothetical protein
MVSNILHRLSKKGKNFSLQTALLAFSENDWFDENSDS